MLFPARSTSPEIMDGDDFTQAELEGNLSDLRFYSRFTGGIALIERVFKRLMDASPPGRRLRILDVGSGGGDVAAALSARLKRRGCDPLVVAADLNPRFLACAHSRIAGDGVRLCAADACSLPWSDGAFDLACSSLVMHHLSESMIRRALGEMRRVTRLGFVILDLRRSALSLTLLWILTRITTRNRLTLNDGPLSVKRALTVKEFRALAAGALGLGSANGNDPLRVHSQGAARLIVTYKHARGGEGPA